MKTPFPKNKQHIPKKFIIDATDQTVGRLATTVSKLLRGKDLYNYSPGVDQGNFVVILNAGNIKMSGKKEVQKKYYRSSHRPGGLKSETFKELKIRIPTRILEKAIWGMLPKGILGRTYYKRLYIYSNSEIYYKRKNSIFNSSISMLNNEWIKVSS